jgi:hypothetical protein
MTSRIIFISSLILTFIAFIKNYHRLSIHSKTIILNQPTITNDSLLPNTITTTETQTSSIQSNNLNKTLPKPHNNHNFFSPISYIHIPKTGGSTIINHLISWAGNESVCNEMELYPGEKIGTCPIRCEPYYNSKKYTIYSGHIGFGFCNKISKSIMDNGFIFATFRQPVNRMVSYIRMMLDPSRTFYGKGQSQMYHIPQKKIFVDANGTRYMTKIKFVPVPKINHITNGRRQRGSKKIMIRIPLAQQNQTSSPTTSFNTIAYVNSLIQATNSSKMLRDKRIRSVRKALLKLGKKQASMLCHYNKTWMEQTMSDKILLQCALNNLNRLNAIGITENLNDLIPVLKVQLPWLIPQTFMSWSKYNEARNNELTISSTSLKILQQYAQVDIKVYEEAIKLAESHHQLYVERFS